MSDEAAYEPGDAVMELVLDSDDEYAGGAVVAAESAEERALRRRDAFASFARFVPGVEGGAALAMIVSVVGLTSSGLIETWAQNKQIADSLLSRSSVRDPLGVWREMGHLRFLGQGAFAAVGLLLAALVLTRWRPERHARWARAVAQAALLAGLVGVVIGLLGYFDVIGGLPSVNDIDRTFQGSTSS